MSNHQKTGLRVKIEFVILLNFSSLQPQSFWVSSLSKIPRVAVNVVHPTTYLLANYQSQQTSKLHKHLMTRKLVEVIINILDTAVSFRV